jgi:transcriptional regulator with XRE-family HTH domain
MKFLSENLRRKLEAEKARLDCTQQELALKMGINEKTLSTYFTRMDKTPSTSQLQKIADYFGQSLPELVAELQEEEFIDTPLYSDIVDAQETLKSINSYNRETRMWIAFKILESTVCAS